MRRRAIVAVALGVLIGPGSASADLLGRDGDYRYVRETSVGADYFTVKATCPGSTKAVGGGFDLGVVSVTSQSFDGPDGGRKPDDGWKYRTYSGSPGPATAYAICSSDLPKYVKKSKPIGAAATKRVKAKCPAGTSVLGGGGNVTKDGSGGLTTSSPIDGSDGDLKRDDGWVVESYNSGVADAELAVQAICADVRTINVSNDYQLPANGGASGPTFCPTGKPVVGVGLENFAPPNAGLLTKLYPFDDMAMGEDDTVPEDGGVTGATNASGAVEDVSATIVCAR